MSLIPPRSPMKPTPYFTSDVSSLANCGISTDQKPVVSKQEKVDSGFYSRQNSYPGKTPTRSVIKLRCSAWSAVVPGSSSARTDLSRKQAEHAAGCYHPLRPYPQAFLAVYDLYWLSKVDESLQQRRMGSRFGPADTDLRRGGTDQDHPVTVIPLWWSTRRCALHPPAFTLQGSVLCKQR